MKYIPIAFFVCVLCQSIYATQQVGDMLVVDGKEFSVYMFRLSDELQESVDKQRTQGSRRASRSNNWDGFYADLEVRGDKLYLTRLSADCLANGDIVKKTIPLGDGEGLFASWFSGELRSVSFGESRRIEQTVHFFFENGLLVEKKLKAVESGDIESGAE